MVSITHGTSGLRDLNLAKNCEDIETWKNEKGGLYPWPDNGHVLFLGNIKEGTKKLQLELRDR